MVDTITKACWSNLEIGPRTLTGFNNPVMVSNYEIAPPSTETATQLESLMEKRKAQLEEEDLRNRQKAKNIQSDIDIDKVEEQEIGISPTGTLTDQLIKEQPLLRSQFKVILNVLHELPHGDQKGSS